MEIRKSGDLPIEKRSGVIPQITSNWSQPIIMEMIHSRAMPVSAGSAVLLCIHYALLPFLWKRAFLSTRFLSCRLKSE